MTPLFVDRRVLPADYNHLGDKLLVTKVFATVQGEGPYAGNRAVFVRLAGCNLGGKGVTAPGCTFCDTDFRFANGQAMSVGQLEHAITMAADREFPDKPSELLVVVTGGEPFLQANLRHLFGLGRLWLHWQIETNGTVCPPWDLDEVLGDETTIVLSPKVLEWPQGGDPLLGYSKPHAQVLERADCLKLVVSADPDSPYHKFPDWVHAWRDAHEDRVVYVSPMAVYNGLFQSPNKQVVSMWDNGVFDIAKCAANHAYAAKLARRHGFVVSMQQHLFCGVE